MHWGRLTDFTSSSSQLLEGYHLQDFSSSPNLVITFLFGNIVWESTVANNCIGHWHETGLQTLKGWPSSSHIGCLGLCLHHYWRFGLSYWCIEVGGLISHQVQVNCWRVISCKVFYPIQIWSSHFCLATLCESQLLPIAVLGIGMRQGCKLLKVVPPHVMSRGSIIKIVFFFLPQTSFLELDHVYICYMISHVKFDWKIPPTTKVMG